MYSTIGLTALVVAAHAYNLGNDWRNLQLLHEQQEREQQEQGRGKMPSHASSASRTLRHPPIRSREQKEKGDPCPFCEISATYPYPKSSTSSTRSSTTTKISSKRAKELRGTTHLILSTSQVMAFLDIMPLSPGHILLMPRRHAPKIMNLSAEEGASLGAWLPILSRAVSRAMGVDDLNVVQNNGDYRPDSGFAWSTYKGVKNRVEEFLTGERASQIVPHVHYHIIPRPSNYSPDRPWTMFGKGPRDDLDDDEAELNAARIKQEIAWELERLGHNEETVVVKTKLLPPDMPLTDYAEEPARPGPLSSRRRHGPKL